MKKIIAFLLAVAMVMCLAACGNSEEKKLEEAVKTYKIAMVTDFSNIDDESFTQTVYEAADAFANSNGFTFDYYKPEDNSTAERVAMVDKAVEEGYNVILCPGSSFAEALTQCAPNYPEVYFIALEVSAEDLESFGMSKMPENLFCAVYQEELAGFMAGYAAVKLGYQHLGFLGGKAVPGVVRYGQGFVQGADLAAKEIEANVTLEYVYGNQFKGDSDITDYMNGWYSEKGVEVVFSCGADIYTSVAEAARAYNGKIIGVDVDQSFVIDEKYGSGMTVTSAMKGLKNTVFTLFTELMLNDNWASWGGKAATLGLVSGSNPEVNYVQLAMETTQWADSFTQDDYKALVSEMYAGAVRVDGSGAVYTPATIVLNIYEDIK